jgi:hypothetical protein
MKNYKLMITAIAMAALWAVATIPIQALAASETPLFKDYQVVEVRSFEDAAASGAGQIIANETVYQITRYNTKFNLFEMVLLEGAQKIPPGKKVLLVKGTITSYAPNSFCTVHCQFVDKASGQVLHETDPRSFRARVANYIAKIIYENKVEK